MPDLNLPNAVDVHIGASVRVQRLLADMSQQTLATKLGLTFQQIQKYEKGTNRIGASRLYRIAEILGVPISFMFEGLPGQKDHANGPIPEHLMELMGTALGQRLVAAFAKLPDKDVRSNLLRLIESIVDVAPRDPDLGERKKRSTTNGGK